MKLSLALLILTVSLFSFAQKPNQKVVAEVNGDKITKWDLDVYHAKRLNLVNQTQATKKQSLNEMIQRKVGIQEAIKSGLLRDPEVRERMNDILYHQQISRELTPRFQKIKVSKQDIQNYYKQNPEYRSSHILYRLPIKPKPEEVKKAFVEMLNVYKKLENNPGRWNEMVKSHSMAKNLPVDGDVGFQAKVRLAPEYYTMLKGKKNGFISRPIRTQYGYHIIKKTGEKNFKDIDADLYRKIVYDQKRDQIMRSYFDDLKGRAKVKIYDKNL